MAALCLGCLVYFVPVCAVMSSQGSWVLSLSAAYLSTAIASIVIVPAYLYWSDISASTTMPTLDISWYRPNIPSEQWSTALRIPSCLIGSRALDLRVREKGASGGGLLLRMVTLQGESVLWYLQVSFMEVPSKRSHER